MSGSNTGIKSYRFFDFVNVFCKKLGYVGIYSEEKSVNGDI